MARRRKNASEVPTPVARGVANRVVGSLTAIPEGVADIAREVGVTATLAVRGAAHAAEQIGGDLLRVARETVDGSVDAVERIAVATNGAVRRVLSGDGHVGRARGAKATGRGKERSR